MDPQRLRSIVESLIFVSEEPVPLAKIRAVLDGIPNDDIKAAIDDLMREYREGDRGFLLEEVAMGYQFRTRPDNVEWVRRLVEKKPARLSKAALETLAIVAYNQPVTRPEIEGFRGVDSGSAVNLLLERRLVKILGRKDAPGKPFIFGTTREFLEIFNLKDLSQLPTLKEIEELKDEDVDPFLNPHGATPDDPADENASPIETGDGEARDHAAGGNGEADAFDEDDEGEYDDEADDDDEFEDDEEYDDDEDDEEEDDDDDDDDDEDDKS
ncbi:SMC-Scp complex subunit ScpB [bacterium]|nr:SMC-Scp complex subunit ScpB [bacterium]